jgi:hypothetical protein
MHAALGQASRADEQSPLFGRRFPAAAGAGCLGLIHDVKQRLPDRTGQYHFMNKQGTCQELGAHPERPRGPGRDDKPAAVVRRACVLRRASAAKNEGQPQSVSKD